MKELIPAIINRRMWEGGPLRKWSEARPTGKFINYAQGGYAGSYVCEQCQMSCDGVYRVTTKCGQQEWLCGKCRKYGSVSH